MKVKIKRRENGATLNCNVVKDFLCQENKFNPSMLRTFCWNKKRKKKEMKKKMKMRLKRNKTEI